MLWLTTWNYSDHATATGHHTNVRFAPPPYFEYDEGCGSKHLIAGFLSLKGAQLRCRLLPLCYLEYNKGSAD